jgi:hypothetical protein
MIPYRNRPSDQYRRHFRAQDLSRLPGQPTPIFFILGALVLALAHSIKPGTTPDAEFWSNALSDAAFVFLTVACLNLLWGWLGGDPISSAIGELRGSIDLIKDSQVTGVQRVLGVSGVWSYEEWMGKLRSARHRVDLMGVNLLVWRKGADFELELLRLVRSGVRVRVLIMDPDHSYLAAHGWVENEETSRMERNRAALVEAKAFFEDLRHRVVQDGRSEGDFEVRTVRRGKMALHLCRIDEEIFAIPYLYSVRASRGPLFVIHGSDSLLFRTLEGEFNQIWDLNRPAALPVSHSQ